MQNKYKEYSSKTLFSSGSQLIKTQLWTHIAPDNAFTSKHESNPLKATQTYQILMFFFIIILATPGLYCLKK